MLKSLRVPEKLFQLASWAVSIVLAGFLIGLGGKIVGDLPGVDERLTVEQFADSAALARGRALRDSLGRVRAVQEEARDRARLRLTAQVNAYRMARASFENWIATRTATTDPGQDPEVVRRTRQLDELKAGERAAQVEVDTLEARQLRRLRDAQECVLPVLPDLRRPRRRLARRRTPGDARPLVYSDHPRRYGPWMNCGGTTVLVTVPVAGSRSIARPIRTARFPSSTIWVSGPEYSAKLDPGCRPALAAEIHSAYGPPTRGYFFSGGVAVSSA